MRNLTILWQFSRPHTLIGSTLSILALFIIAQHGHELSADRIPMLLISLLSALSCNIYITGLNQWSDIEVDRINKPWLPIPAGNLSKTAAFRIVWICGAIALVSSAYVSIGFLVLIALILLIGTAYSLPPLKFKRNHIAAASAIALVRGLLVNLGFYLHFRYEFFHETGIEPLIWPLIIFVAAFSLGIAWFKDIPDTQGDAVYKFGTLAVRSGRKVAFYLGIAVVSIAYLSVIAFAWLGILPSAPLMLWANTLALVVFWVMAYRLNLKNDTSIKRFYMLFWGLFFIEYIVFALAFLI